MKFVTWLMVFHKLTWEEYQELDEFEQSLLADEYEAKQAVKMERVLRLQKDGNKIEINGHLTNDEYTKLIKILVRDGWKAAEKII